MIRRNPVIFFAILMLIGISACVTSTPAAQPQTDNSNSDSVDQPTKEKLPANTLAATNTYAPTKTLAPTKTSAPTKTLPPTATPDPNLLKSGTFVVGSDIKPGLYKGENDGCYWERLKDLSGEFDAIIANGNSTGQFYVEVKDDDFALSINCDMVYLEQIPELTGAYPQTLKPGEYLVGSEIQPGLYKGNEEGCYWARLNNLQGDFDAIKANDNSKGQFYVQVEDSDYALSTNCKVVFLPQIPEHTGEYPLTITPGQYLVGSDIRPGRYKGNGDNCYWARLKDLSGGFDAIITNDNTNGQFYIQIAESDFALSIGCEVEWDSE